MPKLTNIKTNDTCFLCGRQALFISYNSKKLRCVEKITQCPGFVKKAENARKQNMTTEQRQTHMKKMSKLGNETLKNLHKNPDWVTKKSKNISNAIVARGGHLGINNPMYRKNHTEETKNKMKEKANKRNPNCYLNATATKILKGISIPKSQKSEWDLYKEQVINHTRKNWKTFNTFINPLNFKRGKEYELDHKFSITEGFKKNILPQIISHPCNLELIPKNKNRSKRISCSISLDQLMTEIERFNKDAD